MSSQPEAVVSPDFVEFLAEARFGHRGDAILFANAAVIVSLDDGK